jgi:hypothetical protein
MRKFVVDIETSYGRAEHYPLEEKDLIDFLKKKFKEFDGDYVKTISERINSVDLYEYFDLDSKLNGLLNNLSKSDIIKINNHKNCIVSFFIKLKNMEEVNIYISISK